LVNLTSSVLRRDCRVNGKSFKLFKLQAGSEQLTQTHKDFTAEDAEQRRGNLSDSSDKSDLSELLLFFILGSTPQRCAMKPSFPLFSLLKSSFHRCRFDRFDV